jgi:hypothetical protein
MSLPRGGALAALAVLAAVTCFTAVPADARDCRGGGCAKVTHSKKLTAPVGYGPTRARHHRADCCCARRHQPNRAVWQGWSGDSFYLDGVRYRGGNPRGPAAAYNNWEGGFHPVAFWELHLRSSPGG